MLINTNSLSLFFDNKLLDLKCNDLTKSYIISILLKYKTATDDYSKDSIGILYTEAVNKFNFDNFQKIGDWLFFSRIFANQHLKFASKDYYSNIARLSYNKCYIITKRQLKFYEELSDDFDNLTDKTKTCLLDCNKQLEILKDH